MSIFWKSLVFCACLPLGIVHRAEAETPPKEQRNSAEDKAAHASQSQAASPSRGKVEGPSPSPERPNPSQAPR